VGQEKGVRCVEDERGGRTMLLLLLQSLFGVLHECHSGS